MAETLVDAEHGQQTAIALPKWFVWLAGICFTVSAITIGPWVVWQTRITMRLEIQMISLQKIEEKLESVISLPMVLQSIQRRLDVIEKDMNAGSRWTKQDHERYVEPKLTSLGDRLRALETAK